MTLALQHNKYFKHKEEQGFSLSNYGYSLRDSLYRNSECRLISCRRCCKWLVFLLTGSLIKIRQTKINTKFVVTYPLKKWKQNLWSHTKGKSEHLNFARSSRQKLSLKCTILSWLFYFLDLRLIAYYISERIK